MNSVTLNFSTSTSALQHLGTSVTLYCSTLVPLNPPTRDDGDLATQQLAILAGAVATSATHATATAPRR